MVIFFDVSHINRSILQVPTLRVCRFQLEVYGVALQTAPINKQSIVLDVQ